MAEELINPGEAQRGAAAPPPPERLVKVSQAAPSDTGSSLERDSGRVPSEGGPGEGPHHSGGALSLSLPESTLGFSQQDWITYLLRKSEHLSFKCFPNPVPDKKDRMLFCLCQEPVGCRPQDWCSTWLPTNLQLKLLIG